MKNVFIARSISFLFALLLLGQGCGLFKNTTKNVARESKQSNRQLEMGQMNLRRLDKETQVYTYWNDSGFYQFERIKEQTNQAKTNTLNVQEQQQASQELSVKKSEPVKSWTYAGILLALIGCWFVCRRIYP